MTYEAAERSITLTAVGDAMINRPMSVFRESDFIAMAELLRAADGTVGNLEQLFHRWEMSHGGNHGDVSFQVSDPKNLAELRWLGLDAVSTATNHAYDYGEAGYLATLRNCDEYGLLHAGGGVDLGQARAPAFLDTPRGRVALMAACSTLLLPDAAHAAPGMADFPGKPGVNVLRHETVHHVPSAAFAALRELRRAFGLDELEEAERRFHPQTASGGDEDRDLHLFGEHFHLSDGFRVQTRCRPDDLNGIAAWIRGARATADWLVYSFHHHESGADGDYHALSRVAPPEFAIEFAHFAIDNGCDMVVGHGSHFLRGIEVYRGRPIFYSLGNFVFHNETVQRLPAQGYLRQGLGVDATPGDWATARSSGGASGFPADPVFYRSVAAECEFAGGALAEVRLHPLDLGFGAPMSQRGRPVLARDPVAGEILDWLRDASEPFGTEIAEDHGVGVIRA